MRQVAQLEPSLTMHDPALLATIAPQPRRPDTSHHTSLPTERASTTPGLSLIPRMFLRVSSPIDRVRFPILLNQIIYRVRIDMRRRGRDKNLKANFFKKNVLELHHPRRRVIPVRNREPATDVAYSVSGKESYDLEMEVILVRCRTYTSLFIRLHKKREAIFNGIPVPFIAERHLLYGIRNAWLAPETEAAVHKVRQTSVSSRGSQRSWTYVPDRYFGGGSKAEEVGRKDVCNSRWKLWHAQNEDAILQRGDLPLQMKEKNCLDSAFSLAFPAALETHMKGKGMQQLGNRQCALQRDEYLLFFPPATAAEIPEGVETCVICNRPRASLAVLRSQWPS